MKRITMDTSCINLKQENEFINQLEDWQRQKPLEIHKTSVMGREFDTSSRKKENLEKLSDYQEMIFSSLSVSNISSRGEEGKYLEKWELSS